MLAEATTIEEGNPRLQEDESCNLSDSQVAKESALQEGCPQDLPAESGPEPSQGIFTQGPLSSSPSRHLGRKGLGTAAVEDERASLNSGFGDHKKAFRSPESETGKQRSQSPESQMSAFAGRSAKRQAVTPRVGTRQPRKNELTRDIPFGLAASLVTTREAEISKEKVVSYVCELKSTRQNGSTVVQSHSSYCRDLNELVDHQLKAIALKINEKKQLERQKLLLRRTANSKVEGFESSMKKAEQLQRQTQVERDKRQNLNLEIQSLQSELRDF